MPDYVKQTPGTFERRVFIVTTLYVIIVCTGVLGYRLLEGWTWLECLYMTIITITTVGFKEVHTLHPPSQIFTIVLVLLGVGGFTYTIGTITDYLVAGQLRVLLKKRRMRHKIEKLKNHIIVCGFGRIGFQVAEELTIAGKPFLIIEEEDRTFERAMAFGYSAIHGNATNDDVLRRARIEGASGLLATLGTDAANLMLVLSARALNPKLFISARANYEATESKLITAGADRVISPYSIGGRRMAQTVLRPNVIDFLDTVMHGEGLEIWMEDFSITEGGKLDGCAIGEARIRETTGVNILGLRNPEGRMLTTPTPDTVLQAKHILIALGTREQLRQLQSLNS